MGVLIVHLNRAEVSDLLFVGRLGRFLSVAPRGDHRVLVVHDGFERARIVLESNGLTIDSLSHAQWQDVSAEVLSSIKALTRRIVNGLTDEGVPAIGLQCADRNMIARTESVLKCSDPDKFVALATNGVIPVFGPIIKESKGGSALESSEALAIAIANNLSSTAHVRIVSFSTPNGQRGKNNIRPYITSTYVENDETTAIEHIGAETMADTEFWERFS